MAIIEQLAEIELFAELSKRELKNVASFITTVNIKAGRNLTVQGQVGREFMVVGEGEATVRAQRPGHRAGRTG